MLPDDDDDDDDTDLSKYQLLEDDDGAAEVVADGSLPPPPPSERLRDDGIDNYGYDKSRNPGAMGVGKAQRGVFFSEDHAPGGKKKIKQVSAQTLLRKLRNSARTSRQRSDATHATSGRREDPPGDCVPGEPGAPGASASRSGAPRNADGLLYAAAAATEDGYGGGGNRPGAAGQRPRRIEHQPPVRVSRAPAAHNVGQPASGAPCAHQDGYDMRCWRDDHSADSSERTFAASSATRAPLEENVLLRWRRRTC